MLSERLKTRLKKDRPMTSITLRIPADVVESMKAIAPSRGFSGYQTLLKAYISEGLRLDEARYASGEVARFIDALKKRGIPENLLEEVARECCSSHFHPGMLQYNIMSGKQLPSISTETFDDFLAEQGLLQACENHAIKEISEGLNEAHDTGRQIPLE